MTTQKNKSSSKNTHNNKKLYRNGASPKYKNKHNKANINTSQYHNLYLLPISFIVIVLPLIVRMHEYDTPLTQFSWFPYNGNYIDFFLYYKQWFFIRVSLIMAIIIIARAYSRKNFLRFTPILAPLSAYALLAFLSSILSKYRNISISGGFEQFESMFVILGYCLVVYYVYLFVETEADIKFIIGSLVIGIVIFSFIGISQYCGHDFFRTHFGKKMIFPKIYWNSLDTIIFNFEKNRVYGTLYNPNYVGVYASLVLPLLLFLMIFSRKLSYTVLILGTIIGLSISLIGSKSTAGIIAIAVSMIFTLLLLWRYIIKYFYFTVPALLLEILNLVLFNNKSDNYLVKQFSKLLDIKKTEYELTSIETLDDKVVINYKGNSLNVIYHIATNGTFTFEFSDNNGNILPLKDELVDGAFIVDDERFSSLGFSPTMLDDKLSFMVKIDNKEWYFTKQTEDGTYYYYNIYGKYDKITTAPSSFFTGYESYASGRGYIWSRSLPLLKNNFILGTGVDTFAIAFPQQDYVNLYNNGYENQLLTKPHNLYLQIGVETGTLSLISFIIFYGMYFISSFKLYIKSKYDNFYKKVGAGIFIGTFSYMVIGFANDSSITVAPIFWVMMGLGIAVNSKAKLMPMS